MGRRNCCCSTECVNELDNFDRADSTDLGPLWHEEVGDWRISGYQLVEVSGDPNCILFCTTQVPLRSSGEMSMSITVYDHRVGDRYQLYPACDAIGTVGPVTVEFEKIADNDWKVSFIGSTCTDSTIDQAPAYNPLGGLTLGCCVDQDLEVGMMTAGISAQPGYEPLWCDNADAGDGRYCAFGHDTGWGGVFDDFYFTELRTTEHPRVKASECDNCWCWCLNNPPDKHLAAEFREAYFVEDGNPTDCRRASCMTQSWAMDWEYNVGLERWYGGVTVPATASPQNGLATDFYFKLECTANNDDDASWPGRNFLLYFTEGCTTANTNGDGPYQPIAELSTCVPFSLVFGPFYLRCDDLICNVCWQARTPSDMMLMCDEDNPAVCGRYYIIVTGD